MKIITVCSTGNPCSILSVLFSSHTLPIQRRYLVMMTSLLTPSLSALILISQGAEGRIYSGTFLGRETIIKERLSKKYRVKELDSKLTKQRLLQECRCMVKCKKAGVATPSIYFIDQINNSIYIERIFGCTVKEYLRNIVVTTSSSIGSASNQYSDDCILIGTKIGIALAYMHDIDITHGDLTTSNIMVKDDNSSSNCSSPSSSSSPASSSSSSSKDVVLIDFGLSSMTAGVEDKAVDLYVLERAFISTHPGSDAIVQAILQAYINHSKKSSSVIPRLKQVRSRGRKREMFG